MKVHINLNSAIYLNQGIAVFSSEIIKRIIQYEEFDFEGGAYFIHQSEIKMAKRFNMPTKVSKIPSRFIFQTKYAKYFPFKYNTLLKSDADVYVFLGNDLPKGKITVPGKKICVIHDIIPLYRAWEDPEKAKIYYCDKLKEIKEADIIVAVSEFTKQEIIKWFGCPTDKIRVVYNGVDFERYNIQCPQNELENCKKKYNLPDKFMFYMGSAGVYKNLDGIICAYAKLPTEIRKEYKLVLANSRADLKTLAQKLDVEDDIWLLHGIDEAYKVAMYQLASIVLQLSFYEGFGIPLIEGMAAGKPVIAARATCFPEVVGDAGLLADPYSPEDIAEKMEKLITDKEVYSALVDKGFERAKSFSWDNSATQFVSVLKNIQ